MDISEVYGGDSLKAADLQGHEPVVVIATVTKKDFKEGSKLVITFQGKKKAFICNKTNAGRIAYAHGPNTNDWIGREIQLFTDLVDFQGKPTEAIRVRPAPRRPSAPPAEQNGNYTMRKTSGVTLMEHNGQPKTAERVPGSAATEVDLDQEVPF